MLVDLNGLDSLTTNRSTRWSTEPRVGRPCSFWRDLAPRGRRPFECAFPIPRRTAIRRRLPQLRGAGGARCASIAPSFRGSRCSVSSRPGCATRRSAAPIPDRMIADLERADLFVSQAGARRLVPDPSALRRVRADGTGGSEPGAAARDPSQRGAMARPRTADRSDGPRVGGRRARHRRRAPHRASPGARPQWSEPDAPSFAGLSTLPDDDLIEHPKIAVAAAIDRCS